MLYVQLESSSKEVSSLPAEQTELKDAHFTDNYQLDHGTNDRQYTTGLGMGRAHVYGR